VLVPAWFGAPISAGHDAGRCDFCEWLTTSRLQNVLEDVFPLPP
jgi:hypothetical protein